MAYRWFLGLSLLDEVPHFTTLGKNYTRRFKGTDLYERIFEKVLYECMSCGFVDMSTVFIDSTHIKAAANNKKFIKAEALFPYKRPMTKKGFFRKHGMVGKARMEMKVGLTYLCMNLKKLAKMKERYGLLRPLFEYFSCSIFEIFTYIKIPGLGTLS